MIRRNRIVFSYERGNARCSFQGVDGLLLGSIDGADGLNLAYSDAPAADGIGSPAWGMSISARLITIDGWILTIPADERIAELRRCFAAGTTGRLFSTDQDGNVLYIDCKPMVTPAIEQRTVHPRFQIQLRADYPYWQADKQIFRPITPNRQASLTIPGNVPAIYGLSLRVTNGSADGITIRDTDSGAYLRYEGAVDAGQDFSIDCDESGRVTCLLDGQSAINAVTGSLRRLPPGEVHLIVESGVMAQASLRYREAWDGV